MTPEPDGSVVSDGPGVSQDAPVDSGLICHDGSSTLVPAARACSADTDCSVLSVLSCCGGTALGVATAHKAEYAVCLPPACTATLFECVGYGYITDSVQLTQPDATYIATIAMGATVACVEGLCTTAPRAPDAGAAP
jgi:hypothetical protein